MAAEPLQRSLSISGISHLQQAAVYSVRSQLLIASIFASNGFGP